MAIITVASSLLSGCSQVVKTGANVALGFSEKHIVPPILAMDDADMACNSGNALTPAIMATKDMGRRPNPRCGTFICFIWNLCRKSGA